MSLEQLLRAQRITIEVKDWLLLVIFSPQNEVVETVRFWCLFLFFFLVPVSQVQSTSIKFTN